MRARVDFGGPQWAEGYWSWPGSWVPSTRRGAALRTGSPRELWDLEDPDIALLGSHQAGPVRVFFTSWSLSLLRGTAGTNMLDVCVQPAGGASPRPAGSSCLVLGARSDKASGVCHARS